MGFYLKIQCLAKSAASLDVHSPLGFSFIWLHHFSLPTSGAQAVRVVKQMPRKSVAIVVRNSTIATSSPCDV